MNETNKNALKKLYESKKCTAECVMQNVSNYLVLGNRPACKYFFVRQNQMPCMACDAVKCEVYSQRFN